MNVYFAKTISARILGAFNYEVLDMFIQFLGGTADKLCNLNEGA